ncbi:MAG TPA: PAS domain-containing protein, partial [Chthoniobacteraceae bacterium]|nr:PAS domain-containing protein [Chthoniobacteraceae bacterium]
MKGKHPGPEEVKERGPFHLFDRMMEGLALCEIICDGDGHPNDFRYLLVNERFEQIIGKKRKDVIGRTAQELFPGIEPMWIENYARVAITEQSARFEGYLAPLQRYFEVNAHCPQKGQFVAIFLDITDRKTMMDCLCASEERFRLLVENSSDLVCELDGEGRYRYASPNYVSILGYEPGELIGTSAFDLMHPDNVPEGMEKFALPSATLTFRYRHKDGSW